MSRLPTASLLLFTFLILLPLPSLGEEPERPPLRVMTYQVKPLFYLDSAGQPQGYEYTILKSFADHLDRPLEIEFADHFNDVLKGLADGKADLAAAALTVTPTRQEDFDFTTPHFPSLTVLIERKGEESDRIEDLAGKRIAMIRGSVLEEIVRGIPGAKPVHDENSQGLFTMVDQNLADAFVTDSTFYLWKAEKFPQLTLSMGLSEPSYYGFALRQGDPLQSLLNDHLERLKVDGALREFLIEAFGDWGLETILEMSEGFFDDPAAQQDDDQ